MKSGLLQVRVTNAHVTVVVTETPTTPTTATQERGTHIQRATQLTVSTSSVIDTLEAVISSEQTLTLTVSVTLTLDRAVVTHVAERTLTSVWLNTLASHTPLLTHRLAQVCHTGLPVARLTHTLVACVCVSAVLCVCVTVVMLILTLVLGGTGHVTPDPHPPHITGVALGLAQASPQTPADPIEAPRRTPAAVSVPDTLGALSHTRTRLATVVSGATEDTPARPCHTQEREGGGTETLVEAQTPHTLLPAPVRAV